MAPFGENHEIMDELLSELYQRQSDSSMKCSESPGSGMAGARGPTGASDQHWLLAELLMTRFAINKLHSSAIVEHRSIKGHSFVDQLQTGMKIYGKQRDGVRVSVRP